MTFYDAPKIIIGERGLAGNTLLPLHEDLPWYIAFPTPTAADLMPVTLDGAVDLSQGWKVTCDTVVDVMAPHHLVEGGDLVSCLQELMREIRREPVKARVPQVAAGFGKKRRKRVEEVLQPRLYESKVSMPLSSPMEEPLITVGQ